MSDHANELSGKMYGVATGLVGGLAVAVLGQIWRVCGPEQFGAKTNYLLAAPFSPMDAPGNVFSGTPAQYCVSVFSNDFAAVIPWIFEIALGAAGYFIGDRRDKRRAADSPPRW